MKFIRKHNINSQSAVNDRNTLIRVLCQFHDSQIESNDKNNHKIVHGEGFTQVCLDGRVYDTPYFSLRIWYDDSGATQYYELDYLDKTEEIRIEYDYIEVSESFSVIIDMSNKIVTYAKNHTMGHGGI